jgi:hypothetical protein
LGTASKTARNNRIHEHGARAQGIEGVEPSAWKDDIFFPPVSKQSMETTCSFSQSLRQQIEMCGHWAGEPTNRTVWALSMGSFLLCLAHGCLLRSAFLSKKKKKKKKKKESREMGAARGVDRYNVKHFVKKPGLK